MTKRTRIPQADLTKLRKRLPRGYRKLAQERLAAKGQTMAVNSVSEFLTGQFSNDLLLTVLVEIAQEHEEKVKQMGRLARGAKHTSR